MAIFLSSACLTDPELPIRPDAADYPPTIEIGLELPPGPFFSAGSGCPCLLVRLEVSDPDGDPLIARVATNLRTPRRRPKCVRETRTGPAHVPRTIDFILVPSEDFLDLDSMEPTSVLHSITILVSDAPEFLVPLRDANAEDCGRIPGDDDAGVPGRAVIERSWTVEFQRDIPCPVCS